MPLNVIVYQVDEGSSMVASIESGVLSQMGEPMLEQMAAPVEEVLSRVFKRVAS